MPRHLSFSGSTSNFAAASLTLGLSELLILAAGFLDIELDFDMLEGGQGQKRVVEMGWTMSWPERWKALLSSAPWGSSPESL